MIETQPCPVNKTVLQNSNEIWNLLSLNSPWSVGLTSYLIRQAEFDSYSDWREFYFSSGDLRLIEIEKLEPNIQHSLIYYSAYHAQMIVNDLSEYNDIAYRYGRSLMEFDHKAEVLCQGYFGHTGESISIAQARQLIEYRVLAETWNGIYIREVSTINKLKSIYPKLVFKSISAQKDFEYGVDYLIYYDKNLICGLQIKPLSYRSTKSYVERAKAANKAKNEKFSSIYRVSVFTIMSTQQGDITEDSQSTDLYKCLSRF